jgi:hypothetical protein
MLPLLLALVLLQHGTPLPERARDPWVFRSVLDGRARMVTLALSKEMWLAYDAQDCGLYKCWKGGVELEGAVYTTVHGAQPTSKGPVYTRGLDGPPWSAEVGGEAVAVRAQWRGYFFHGGRAHLKFELQLPDGRAIDVQETSDFFTSEQIVPEDRLPEAALTKGMPVLYRSWHLGPVPDDVRVLLALCCDGEHMRQRLTHPDGILMRERIVEEPGPDGVARKTTYSTLPFDARLRAANVITFFAPLPEPAPPAADKTAPGGSAPAKPGAAAPAKGQ